jgi:hypothetical protein
MLAMATVLVMTKIDDLFEHQKIAIEKLKSGSILVGGVGSGKSMASLAYYFEKECGGRLKPFSSMKNPKDLYVITTARKRDTLEWDKEMIPFLLSRKDGQGPKVVVDSWNNITKYVNVKNAFFIFDEQRVVGSGVWVKSFLKITKSNNWLLLSATPGDTWMDYIPVFVANGFYKNRTEFIRRHVVYNGRTKFPKVERYVEVSRLVKIRDSLIVAMHYKKKTIAHDKTIVCDYDEALFKRGVVNRWNPYKEEPIKDVSELCYTMRKVVNSSPDRIEEIKKIIAEKSKVIIFYNFNYELDMLLALSEEIGVPCAQWNGHKHQLIPETMKWMYFVQYAAGSEGWNCIETDTIAFYSQNYSYKATVQAAGRIDRLNTPFTDLYYYYLRSEAIIDLAIYKALKSKKNFNEYRFMAA